MRTSILLIALIGFLAFSPAGAHERDDRSDERDDRSDKRDDRSDRDEGHKFAAECAVLEGTSRGLHSLCVKYCRKTDQSNVDLNDSKSVKRAASALKTLLKYNDRKRPYDPEMPCFKNTGPPDDGGGTGGGGDTGGGGAGGGETGGGGTTPPDGGTGGGGTTPPASCKCWTGAELAAIDGVLPDAGFPPVVECTVVVDATGTTNQVMEGYDFGIIGVEGVAWATVDPIHNGCFFSRSGVPAMNLSLEQPDAENCQAEILAQCAAIGQ